MQMKAPIYIKVFGFITILTFSFLLLTEIANATVTFTCYLDNHEGDFFPCRELSPTLDMKNPDRQLYIIEEDANFYYPIRKGEIPGLIPKYEGRPIFKPKYIGWEFEINKSSPSTIRNNINSKLITSFKTKEFIYIEPTVRDANGTLVDLDNTTQLLTLEWPITVLDPYWVNTTGGDQDWSTWTWNNMTDDKGGGGQCQPRIEFCESFRDGDITGWSGSTGNYYVSDGWLIRNISAGTGTKVLTFTGLTVPINATYIFDLNATYDAVSKPGIAINNATDVKTYTYAISTLIRIVNTSGSTPSSVTVTNTNKTVYHYAFRQSDGNFSIFRNGTGHGSILDTNYPVNKDRYQIQDGYGGAGTNQSYDNFGIVDSLTGSGVSPLINVGDGQQADNITLCFSEYGFAPSIYIIKNGTGTAKLIASGITNCTTYNIGSGNGSQFNISINGTAPNSTALNIWEYITIGNSSVAAPPADNDPVVLNMTPTNGTSYELANGETAATIPFNVTATDDQGFGNATLWVWNYTGEIFNYTFIENADAVENITGTYTGTLNDTIAIDDVYFQIQEVTGNPGFDFYFNFTGVDPDITQWRWHVQADHIGVPSHIIWMETWNYSTNTYVPFIQVVTADLEEDYYSPYYPVAEVVSGGIAQLRIVHNASGNINDVFNIDHIGLESLAGERKTIDLTNNTENSTAADLPVGIYLWNYEVRDNASNIDWNNTNGTVIVLPDTTAPSATFVPPTPANLSFTNLNWTYINVTFDQAPCCVRLEFDGINYTMNETANGGFFRNMTNLTDGTHEFRVWGNDTSGNRNVTDSRNITVDTVFPLVVIDAPTDGVGYNHSNWTGGINGSCTDTNLDNITTNSSIFSGIDTTTPFNFTNVSRILDAYYSVLLLCYDEAGNLNNTEVINFLYNDSAAAGYVNITIDDPNNATYTSIVSIPMRVAASGNTSALDTWQFKLTNFSVGECPLCSENWTTFTPNYTTLFDLNNGNYNLSVRVTMTDGFENTTEVFFTVNYTGLLWEYPATAGGTRMQTEIYMFMLTVAFLSGLYALNRKEPATMFVSAIFFMLAALESTVGITQLSAGVEYTYSYVSYMWLWGGFAVVAVLLTIYFVINQEGFTPE